MLGALKREVTVEEEVGGQSHKDGARMKTLLH